jgi:hypothetical protein
VAVTEVVYFDGAGQKIVQVSQATSWRHAKVTVPVERHNQEYQMVLDSLEEPRGAIVIEHQPMSKNLGLSWGSFLQFMGGLLSNLAF